MPPAGLPASIRHLSPLILAALLILGGGTAAHAGMIHRDDFSGSETLQDFSDFTLPADPGNTIAVGDTTFATTGGDDATWRIASHNAGTGVGLVAFQPSLDVTVSFELPVLRAGIEIATSAKTVTKVGFYDVDGELLNNVYVPSSGNLGIAPAFAGWESVSGIASIRIMAAGRTQPTLFDNLRYETLPAPEPAAVSLVALGLAVLAIARSRRVPSLPGRGDSGKA